jgi:hypothetical protein
MSSSTQPRASLGGDILSGVAGSQQLQGALASVIVSAILGLIEGFMKRATAAPVAPVVVPSPSPAPAAPGFPDDVMPAPKRALKVGSVKLVLSRAQYSRERFPEQYTEQNPFGFLSQADCRALMDGSGVLPFGSKFWLDLTPFDESGRQITRPEMIAAGLSFKTNHHCGDAFIVGHGELPSAPGEPAPYETNDTDAISNGITAWKSSLGYLHQMKAWGEGSFPVVGAVDGVMSNSFTLRVS